MSSSEGKTTVEDLGSWAIQGRAGSFVEWIQGSYYNVVGLPIKQVLYALQILGWTGERASTD